MKATTHAHAFSTLQTDLADKGVYQLAHPFQLDVKGVVGVSLNIRRGMANQLDIEIGSDLAKSLTTYYDFYRLRQRVPNQAVIDFVNRDKSQDSITMLYRTVPQYKPWRRGL